MLFYLPPGVGLDVLCPHFENNGVFIDLPMISGFSNTPIKLTFNMTVNLSLDNFPEEEISFLKLNVY